MSKAFARTNLLITWLALSLVAALGCGSHSGATEPEGMGSLQMRLTTTAGGVRYRLASVQVLVTSDSTSQVVSETDPNEDTLSIILPTGTYSLVLQQWQLQRADDQGVFWPVQAVLQSSATQSASILEGATTTVTYSFVTDGVIVSTGVGRLDIGLQVEVADAACGLLGTGCQAGDGGTSTEDGGTASEGGSEGGAPSTESLLAAQAPNCLSCARDNGCFDPTFFGGTCENPPTGAHGSIDGTRSFGEMCLLTLHDVFASGCAATLQETPCLCGTADAAACLAGSATPNGPIYPTYVADFGSDMPTILANFTNPTFGTGMANAIIQCVGAFDCGCLF